MSMLKRYILYGILFCCFCPAGLLAQTVMQKIDSLQKVLKTAKEDTNKVNTLNALGTQLRYSADYEGEGKYGNLALLLAEKIKYKRGVADALTNIGASHRLLGNYEEGMKNFQTAFKIYEEIKDQRGMTAVYLNIGSIYLYKSNFPESIKNVQAAIKLSSIAAAVMAVVSMIPSMTNQ